MKVYDCIIHKNLDALHEAFAAGADPNEELFSSPILHTVVEHEWIEGLRAFVEAGVDLDARNDREDTPLIVAVVHKKAESTRILLEAGADHELTNKLGSTPFNYVVRMNAGLEMTSSSFVIEDGVKKETVHDPNVPRQAALEVLRVLAEAGAKVDAEDSRGMTALHEAASAGDQEFLEAVLSAGADPNHGNANGFRAIHAACGAGHVEAVNLLLSRGADPSVADTSGFTPLHDASAAGNRGLVEALLEAGADKSAQVTQGWKEITEGMTPADVARLKGHEAIAELLS